MSDTTLDDVTNAVEAGQSAFGDQLDRVEAKVVLQRIHFYDQDNIMGPHGIAVLPAGRWYWVPAEQINTAWDVQKALFGDAAKDWNEIGYSGGSTKVDLPEAAFGEQVHVYPGL